MKNGPNVLFKNKLKNRVDRPFYGQLSNQEIFKRVNQKKIQKKNSKKKISKQKSKIYFILVDGRKLCPTRA